MALFEAGSEKRVFGTQTTPSDYGAAADDGLRSPSAAPTTGSSSSTTHEAV